MSLTRFTPVCGAGALVLLTVAAYVPALSGGFIWDDDEWVTENPALRTLDGLRRIWLEPRASIQYYPLTYTTWWIDWQLWGDGPFAYHLENVLLHAGSACLVWLILRRLAVPGAWTAAAIFALHPVHVESVAWVTERKNVLSGLFYLASLLAYLRFAGLDQGTPSPRRSWWSFGVVLVLFLCAVLSKTVTCTLPAALLLIHWWRRGLPHRQDLVPLVFLLLLGVVLGATTAWLEQSHVRAQGHEWAMSLTGRCLVAGRALCFYAGKLCWPSTLTFIYARWSIRSDLWWSYLFPLASCVVVLALWLARSRVGKAPLVAVLFFAGTLFPALGFFNVYFTRYSFVADHFQYLASLGLIALGTAAGARLTARLSARGGGLQAVVCAVVLGILGRLTWVQAGIYRDTETVWLDTLKKNPDCWLAHNNLGMLLDESGLASQAVAHYQRALVINPRSPEALNNLGTARLADGRTAEAIEYFAAALRSKPDYYRAHHNWAQALLAQGRAEEAVEHFRAALHFNPYFPAAWNDLAVVLQSQNRLEEAARHFRQALSLKPGAVLVHMNLAAVLMAAGSFEDAADHYQAVLKSDPHHVEALFNLGLALGRQGKTDDAIRSFRQVLALDPLHAAARERLTSELAARARPTPTRTDGP